MEGLAKTNRDNIENIHFSGQTSDTILDAFSLEKNIASNFSNNNNNNCFLYFGLKSIYAIVCWRPCRKTTIFRVGVHPTQFNADCVAVQGCLARSPAEPFSLCMRDRMMCMKNTAFLLQHCTQIMRDGAAPTLKSCCIKLEQC